MSTFTKLEGLKFNGYFDASKGILPGSSGTRGRSYWIVDTPGTVEKGIQLNKDDIVIFLHSGSSGSQPEHYLFIENPETNQ